MELKINKKKFEVFLEVARKLNDSFKVVPILYGSLGLYKIIGESGESHDIDVLVPGEYIHQRWSRLINLMWGLGFELKDEHEHEFVRKGKIVAFGNEADLSELLQIDIGKLKVSEVNKVKFKELSAEQYLCVYKFMLRDDYRQEKRGKEDKVKISLIAKYISKT